MKYSQAWSLVQSLEPRQKVAETHKLAHQIHIDIKNKTVDLEEFDTLLSILNKAGYYSGGSGAYSRERNMLVRYRLQSLGLSDVKIVQKINGDISVESGMLGLADFSFDEQIGAGGVSDKEISNMERQGKYLSVGTGGDGIFPVQLRLVEAAEPMLTEKEYKLVESSTDTIVINVPSGKVAVGDLFMLKESNISMDVDPGTYKACAYIFDNRKGFRAHYFVISKIAG